jgi:hypothetical protein
LKIGSDRCEQADPDIEETLWKDLQLRRSSESGAKPFRIFYEVATEAGKTRPHFTNLCKPSHHSLQLQELPTTTTPEEPFKHASLALDVRPEGHHITELALTFQEPLPEPKPLPATNMPSTNGSDPEMVPNGPKPEPEQYKPELSKSPQGDFMRPAIRRRGTSSANTNGVGVQVEDTRICVVMVGLPARGKSLIAQKGKYPIHPHVSQELIDIVLLTMFLSRSLSRLAQHHREVLQRRVIPSHQHTTAKCIVLRHF